jgi:hypothetical protein
MAHILASMQPISRKRGAVWRARIGRGSQQADRVLAISRHELKGPPIGVLNTAPLRAMVRAAPGDGQRYDVLLETRWESRNGGHDGRTALHLSTSICEALETDCVAGQVGFEPANPSASHLIGFA